MSDPNVLGHFVWHELMTTDTRAAGAFYVKAAGWATQAWAQDHSYTMFMASDRPVAGLMVLPEPARKMGAPPNWLTYVGTPNVDQTIVKAVGLGARVLTPATDIPNVGRFAVLQDPQDAVFAVITMAQLPPVSDTAPPVGDFSWHELATTNGAAAWRFYSKLFGWKATEAMDMGPTGVYQMFGPGTRSVGGMYPKQKEMPGPSAWTPYIRVKDSKQVAARVAGLGGTVMNGPMQVPGGDWIVMGMDPQGAVFATHSVTPAVAAKPAAAAKPAGAAKKDKGGAKTVAKSTAKKAVRKAKPASRAAKKGAAKKTTRPAPRKAGSKKATRPATKKRTATKAAAIRRRVAKKTARPAARKRTPAQGRSRKAARKTAKRK